MSSTAQVTIHDCDASENESEQRSVSDAVTEPMTTTTTTGSVPTEPSGFVIIGGNIPMMTKQEYHDWRNTIDNGDVPPAATLGENASLDEVPPMKLSSREILQAELEEWKQKTAAFCELNLSLKEMNHLLIEKNKAIEALAHVEKSRADSLLENLQSTIKHLLRASELLTYQSSSKCDLQSKINELTLQVEKLSVNSYEREVELYNYVNGCIVFAGDDFPHLLHLLKNIQARILKQITQQPKICAFYFHSIKMNLVQLVSDRRDFEFIQQLKKIIPAAIWEKALVAAPPFSQSHTYTFVQTSSTSTSNQEFSLPQNPTIVDLLRFLEQ